MRDHARFIKSVAEQHFLLEAFVASLTHGRGGAELVDELVQQTIAVAWSRFDAYDGSRPFGPWLRGIAALTVQAKFRQESSRTRIREGAEFEADFVARLEGRFASLEPDRAVERSELSASLRACVDSLRSEFAEIVSLYYWREMDSAHAAAVLGVHIETVRKRLQRARAQIASCLESKGYPVGRDRPSEGGEATA